MTIFTMG